MVDELKQIQRETFDKIILFLMFVGVLLAAIALSISGMTSPWVVRGGALFFVALIAYGVRLVGRLDVAVYVLIMQLIGLSTEVLLQADMIGYLTAYFFIPIILIAGLLLSAPATFLVLLTSITLTLAALALTGQFSLERLAPLLPAFGFALLMGVFILQARRQIIFLAERLQENRTLLRTRALELMQRHEQTGLLQQTVADLQGQRRLESNAAALEAVAFATNDHLHRLLHGTTTEVAAAVEALEQDLEQLDQQNGSTSAGQHERLTVAWQKLDYLRTLNVNLQTLMQVEQDDFQLAYEPVDLGLLLSELVGVVRGLARHKPLEIDYCLAADLSTVPADPARLRQVLLHLLSNAIKYTDQGRIEIRAEIDHGQAVIFVTDTGIGLTADEAEQVFTLFGRGQSRQAKARQGAGLGLAISRQLIEQHGGRMWVASEAGTGSTFYLALPLQPDKQRQSVVHRSDSFKSTLRLGSKQKVAAASPSTKIVAPAIADLKAAAGSNGGSRKKPSPSLMQPVVTTLPVNPKAANGSYTVSPYRRPSRQATEPVRRYHPLYIQRFGMMLLALLLIVIGSIGIVAAMNDFNANDDTVYPPAVAVAEAEIAAQPPPTVTPQSTGAPANVVVPVGPTPTPSPSPSPSSSSTATSTATVLPTMPSATPSPSATPLPPTATVTATATATVLPTATVPQSVAAQPAAVIQRVPPAQLIFAGGLQGIAGVDLDGGAASALALPVSPNSRVSWSPAGQVLFTAIAADAHNIYVADAAGRPQPLVDSAADDIQPSWSPDGRQVAFSSGRSGNFDIFTLPANGGQPLRLTDSRGYDEWPAWSPDGQRLAFVSDRDGNVEIYVMNSDGSNQQRLTYHAADDWPAAWSPDGEQLVFASNRAGDWNLYLLPLAGGQPRPLTAAPGDERDPSWSPDGRRLAFVANQGGNFEVYTLTLPTAEAVPVPPAAWTQITDSPNIDERFPAWGRLD